MAAPAQAHLVPIKKSYRPLPVNAFIIIYPVYQFCGPCGNARCSHADNRHCSAKVNSLKKRNLGADNVKMHGRRRRFGKNTTPRCEFFLFPGRWWTCVVKTAFPSRNRPAWQT
jgi:hypothetical protein